MGRLADLEKKVVVTGKTKEKLEKQIVKQEEACKGLAERLEGKNRELEGLNISESSIEKYNQIAKFTQENAEYWDINTGELADEARRLTDISQEKMEKAQEASKIFNETLNDFEIQFAQIKEEVRNADVYTSYDKAYKGKYTIDISLLGMTYTQKIKKIQDAIDDTLKAMLADNKVLTLDAQCAIAISGKKSKLLNTTLKQRVKLIEMQTEFLEQVGLEDNKEDFAIAVKRCMHYISVKRFIKVLESELAIESRKLKELECKLDTATWKYNEAYQNWRMLKDMVA